MTSCSPHPPSFRPLCCASPASNCPNVSVYLRSVTTVYCTLQPVGTVILSLIIFSQLVTLPEGVGGVVVALGLVVTVYGRMRETATLGDPDQVTDASYAEVKDTEGLSGSLGLSSDGIMIQNALLVSDSMDEVTVNFS